MIFYFLRADRYTECKVIITDKEVNLGDGEGMQVPCLLKISRTKNMLQILCKNIQNYIQKYSEFQGFLFYYDTIYRYFLASFFDKPVAYCLIYLFVVPTTRIFW